MPVPYGEFLKRTRYQGSAVSSYSPAVRDFGNVKHRVQYNPQFMDDVEKPEEGTGLESQDQSAQSPASDQGAGTAETSPVSDEQAGSRTVSVLGREYDLSNPDQTQELVEDYDRLGRMYTPLSQKLSELEKIVQRGRAAAAWEYSDLGYDPESEPVTVKQFNEILSREKEDMRMEADLQRLASQYHGGDGRPKFDRGKVLTFCLQNGIANPEHGYLLQNRAALEEWGLRQAKAAPQAPPSSGGEGAPRGPQPKKRVFGATEEGQVSLRDAMLETLEQSSPTITG